MVGELRELHHWQRRAAILALAPDRSDIRPGTTPDTYCEFLARTSGPLIKEPSARARRGGGAVG